MNQGSNNLIIPLVNPIPVAGTSPASHGVSKRTVGGGEFMEALTDYYTKRPRGPETPRREIPQANTLWMAQSVDETSAEEFLTEQEVIDSVMTHSRV